MQWSPQQDQAIKAVRAWLADPSGPQIFRLFGYAGTGKTTLAQELAGTVKGSVLYATFTGKAALVLRKKGGIHRRAAADRRSAHGEMPLRMAAGDQLSRIRHARCHLGCCPSRLQGARMR